MNRRNFLKTLSIPAVFYLYPSCNLVYGESEGVTTATLPSATKTVKRNKLILIELKGGNDGLNTLIPFNNKHYYNNRPKIAIKAKEVLPLDKKIGLHPSLEKFLPIWKDNQMAWIQGVGYEDSNRSHFRAIEIWDTASIDEEAEHMGWVSQLLKNETKEVAINTHLGPLYREGGSSLRINTPQELAKLGEKITATKTKTTHTSLTHILQVQNSVNQLAQSLLKKLPSVPKPKKAFPKGKFGKELETVYTLIASDLDVSAYKISLGGFDTHVNQLGRHANRLSQLANGLAIFRENLQHIGLWDSTLVMSYSEFGRRLKENAGKG
ncbi:MAG: DUF1501 domain-containing protein, partial [Endozoicomonadaceae bacterium]|nr:DUF1501 domain-containing protein [Endozoicomonadaceae bacterium]